MLGDMDNLSLMHIIKFGKYGGTIVESKACDLGMGKECVGSITLHKMIEKHCLQDAAVVMAVVIRTWTDIYFPMYVCDEGFLRWAKRNEAASSRS